MNGLWPREHGAYAQLACPLITGIVLARGHAGAAAFAVAATAMFLAHEPLALIMGTRGVRLRDQLVGAARRRLVLLAAVVLAGLVWAVASAPFRAWQAAIVPGLLAVLLVPLFFTARVKTLVGELVVAAAFAAVVLPMALSGSGDWPRAWTATAVWLSAFATSIVSVHAVKAAYKGSPRARWLVPAAPVLAAVVGSAAIVAWLAAPAPWDRAVAALPPVVAVAGVAVVRPHPRHLKRIGWTMVAAYAVALVLLLVA